MTSPSGSPNSACNDLSACRAIAISVLAASFCSSRGVVFVPTEGNSFHAAALVAHHRVQPQPHLVSTLGRDQQHAALPLDDMAEKRLAGGQCRRQIKHHEGLAGTPLAREQAMPDSRDQMLDQPALQRARIRIPVRIELRQLRIGLRWLVLQLGIVILLQLGIVIRIWRRRRLLGLVDLIRIATIVGWIRWRLRLIGIINIVVGWIRWRGYRLALRRLPAVELRQCALGVLAGASVDLAPKPALADIFVGNAVRELPQVFVDLIDAPVAAEIMADDDVESVAAITAQRTLAHDPLDAVDVVAGPTTIEAVTVDL